MPVQDTPLLRGSLIGLLDLTNKITQSAKSRGGVVKYGVEWGEYIATPVYTSVLPTLQRYGEPVVSKLDNAIGNVSLTQVYQTAQKSLDHKAIVSPEWFERVNKVFNDSSAYAETFYNSGLQLFITSAAEGKSFLSKSEFLSAFEEKMGKFWSEKLVAPATTLYITLSSSLEEQKKAKITEFQQYVLDTTQFQKLGKEWETQVVTAFNATIDPARVFYNYLLEHYANLGQGEEANTEFLRAMQGRIGGLWNNSLKQPFEEFLAKARNTDMKTIHAALDYNKDGKITMQDFVGLANAGVAQAKGYAMGYASKTWSGLLQMSSDTVDYWIPDNSEGIEDIKNAVGEEELPEHEKHAAEPVTLTALKTRISKRLKSRATQGLQQIRMLSATRVKEIIHVDLIAYAEYVIDQVKTPKTAQDVKSEEKLSEALATLESSVTEAEKEASVPSATEPAAVQENTEGHILRMAYLKGKLMEAIQRVAAVAGRHLPGAVFGERGARLVFDRVKNLFYWQKVGEAPGADASIGEGEDAAKPKVEEAEKKAAEGADAVEAEAGDAETEAGAEAEAADADAEAEAGDADAEAEAAEADAEDEAAEADAEADVVEL